MTTGAGVVTSVRVAHDQATLPEIEAVTHPDPGVVLDELLARPAVEEAFFIQTCHRVEGYVVTGDREAGERALDAVLDPGPAARYAGHRGSLRHLLRVGAGLESVVVGEDQILGQLRDAADRAREHEALGGLLEAVVLKAVHVGERARTETAINEGAVSIGSAAVRYVARRRDLDGATAVVVGAGEMGRLAATALTEHVDRLTVCNRTPERAASVAAGLPEDVTAEGAGLEALEGTLAEADLAVTATAAEEPVVDARTLADAGELLVVDLGQPRDVAAGEPPDPVEIHDLEDVQAVTERTTAAREAAAEEVAAMVETELGNLLDQLKRGRADDVIAAMYESAEAVKRREVRAALDRMTADGELTDEQRAAVEDLADALVNQLLAAPTRSLRDAAAEDDWTTIDTALALFDPSFDEGSPFPESVPDPEDAAGGPPDWVLADDD